VNKLNDTASEQEKQVVLMNIKQKIIAKLPTTLEESAKATGAIIRKRKIKRALDLITILFIYALTDISQRVLAAFAMNLGIADISDQAWQKKL